MDPVESVNLPEGGKVGAFKAGVLKGDFAQCSRYGVCSVGTV